MTKDLIRKYIWLIDTINQAGSAGITFSEINKKWMLNDLLSNGDEYPKRSFHNHVEGIREVFGIEITCRKSHNAYYIANRGDVNNTSGYKGWLLDALSLSSQLDQSVHLKDRILLEENPSGREFLPTILEAMRESKMLTFSYKPFWMEDDSCSNLYHVEPYALKSFKRRWYLLAKYGDNPLKVYALDRILDMDIEFEEFKIPASFDAETYFNTCFGIIVADEKPQLVKLKVDDYQAKYLRSLPLHHSQKELERTDKYTVFSFFLCPTFDFIQEILSMGKSVEVLSPKDLRSEISRIGKEIGKKNSKRG
ncbi:MAG: WYL domain-containing protein [Bacteroidales bacterium]|nr:WYL domain-containing protein [Bacteroidales bacterium]